MKYNQTEIKNFIDKNYNIEVCKIKRFSEGLMNLNYLIETVEKKYVFRISHLKNVNEINAIVKILQTLDARKFPSPRLKKSKNEKFILLIKRKPCLLYEYFDGKTKQVFNKNLLLQTGNLLGKMHKVLKDFKLSIMKSTWDLEELKIIVQKNKRKMINSKFKDAKILMDFIEKELIKFNFPKNLPAGITHQDVKPENIIIKNNKIQGLVDFDNAYHGVLLHDLTTPIIWTCFKNYQLDFQLLNNYLRGYNQNRKLLKLEKKYLLEAIKFRLLRESFIGPFAIYPYPEHSKERSDYFRKLYKKFYKTTQINFDKMVKI